MGLRHRGLAALAAATGLAVAAAFAPGAAAVPTGGAAGPPAAVPPARALVEVGSYNVYLGADLGPLFTASTFPELVGRAGQVYAAMQATNFPERAGAIADQLAEERPDVVGLQEVALWETAPGTVLSPTAAFTPTYDFLPLLLDELAERGVPYEPVAGNTNFSGTLPIALGGPPPLFPSSTWARFTDHDVIIVRSGLPDRHLSVDADSVREQNFDAELTIPSWVPGVPAFAVPRGWSSVDVTAKGVTFTFVNTHLEAFNDPTQPFGHVRNLQAAELAAEVAASAHPPILVGDINSRPPCDGFNTTAYQTLIGAGLAEVWPVVHPRDPCGGPTSGQAADLLNAQSGLDHRIDVVMYDPTGFTPVRTEVIGDEQRDRSTPTGFWPSDHAGVVASLKTVRP